MRLSRCLTPGLGVAVATEGTASSRGERRECRAIGRPGLAVYYALTLFTVSSEIPYVGSSPVRPEAGCRNGAFIPGT